MRKSFIAFISMTAAAMAVLSCAKVADVMDAPSKGITINVKAGDDMTRTMAVDGEIPTIKWTAGDNVLLFEVVDGALVDASTSDGALIDEEGRASFVTPIDWDDAGTAGTSAYQYSAVYPSSAVYASGGVHFLFLPDDQYLVGNNFSDDSDLLISTVLDHGNTRATQDEDIMFTFRRVGTVVRLRLKGIPEGAKINQVTLQAPVDIAGTINYDPITGKVDPASAFEIYGTETVNLIASDLVATGDDVIWFRVMCDEDWAEGAKFFIKVVTDQGNYEKEVTLPVAIRFPDGGLTKFGVDLSEVAPTYLTVPILWDFEDGVEGWTSSDDDGDGNEWTVSFGNDPSYVHSGSTVLVSESYNGTVLTPDNWAFTPKVQLTEGNYLSFWVRADDIDYRAEHYAVYIKSESGELTTLIDESEYPVEDFFDVDGYFQRIVVQIPEAFDNQVVSIGFRHFNCTDLFRLRLDDVEILEEEPVVQTRDYADYLGEWTDGSQVFTIEQAVEGSSYYITGLKGQDFPAEAIFYNNRLYVYEQTVYSDDSYDLTLQGLFITDDYGLDWDHDLSSVGTRILFIASYNPNTGALDIIPFSKFVDYIWLLYTDGECSGYYGYDEIPGPMVPYADNNTYIFQDDFEAGTDSWSLFDKDGDGYKWGAIANSSFPTHSGNYCLMSRSWVSAGALNPDNYAFTPAITLTTDNYLSFWVTADQAEWCQEHYAVYVTTEAPSDSNLPTSNPIFEDTYSMSAAVGGNLVELGSNGYQHYAISLAEYAGQTVYIGFRHFDCTDQDFLLLDDVGVIEGTPVFGSETTHAAPRKAPSHRVHSSSIMKDAPKVQRHVFKNSVDIKSR